MSSVADHDYEDTAIVGVTDEGDGWAIEQDRGWHFYVPKKHGVEPKVGMVARFYPRGIGRTVRGLTLDGRTVFYRTESEERARFEAEQAERNADRRRQFEEQRIEHDGRIAALPEAFRLRIERFQASSPDWRWQFEGYELMCCEQAVLFADTLKTIPAMGAFQSASWDEQKRLVPGLDEGHSGNTFGFACRLARSYLIDPELVYADHGAMASLVGCEEFGCPPVLEQVP